MSVLLYELNIILRGRVMGILREIKGTVRMPTHEHGNDGA